MSKTYLPLPEIVTIRKSEIHGLGVFATTKIPAGHDFGITHVADERFQDGYIRMPLGGFINYADNPNCEFVFDADLIRLRTMKDIGQDEELTAKYQLYKPA